MEPKKLFLLDAYALIFRAYYALIQSPRFSSSGFNTSAIFGFVNTLQDVLKREAPTHIAVCFDPPGPTFRHEAFEQYKAEREKTPEDIKKSIPYIKRIIEAYHIPVIEVPGYEADDVIGTLAMKAQAHGFTTFMMTPDKDFGQLVTDHNFIYKPGWRGGDFEIRGVKEICAKYELDNTKQVIDILALMGDKIDNIPGCPGVGQVTAVKLIKQFHSVENLIANTDQLKGALKAKIETNSEGITFSKFLATIKIDAPIEFSEESLKREAIDYNELREIFNELEFKTLITRIIDKREGAFGEAPAAEPTKVVSKQGSLFGDEPTEESSSIASEAALPANYNNLQSTTHRYQTLENIDKVNLLVGKLKGLKEYGVSVITAGDNNVEMKIIGVGICASPGNAVYIPVPTKGDERTDILDALRPLFENNTATYVSADVKHDMLALRSAGIELTAPYFDTAVAHYLVQPEMNHDLPRLSSILLNYEPILEDSLTEGKGKNKQPLSEAPLDKLSDFACEQADIVLQLKAKLIPLIKENGMEGLLRDMELPLIEVLANMEWDGVRLDVSVLNDFSVQLNERMHRIQAECYELAGEEFNIGSPMKVGEILFDKLKIDDKAKKTKSGQYSTTEEVLVKLKDKNPIVGKILELRGIKKLLTTYTEALPLLINPRTNRVHTTYNQTVTATGRLSSTNPNMQNIPVRSDEGREIRKAFIPAEGNIFFSADYSQIELRLVADLSKDDTMLGAFKEGDDIHALTAAKIYHEKLEDVTADQRRKAKTANFGILYGISAFGLSQRLEIPRSEAKLLIDGYFESYPKVHDYMNKSIEVAKKQHYVTTQFGRRRMLPDINSHNAVVRSFSERNAINAPIQGTAADIIKIAMVNIFKRFKTEGLESKMIMQVHDELNFDVIPEELDRVRDIVTTEMDAAYKGDVPLTASWGAAKNWLEAH